MSIFIVEGRCDCARLARCQLLSERLSALIPSVSVKFYLFEPEAYLERLKCIARSFPSCDQTDNSGAPVIYTADGQFLGDDKAFIRFVTDKYKIEEAEPDLEGDAMQVALQGSVDFNTAELRRKKHLQSNGMPIKDQAEAITEALAAASLMKPILPVHAPLQDGGDPPQTGCLQREKGTPVHGFKLIPDIRFAQAVDGGSHFTVWSSVFSHKRSKIGSNCVQKQSEMVPGSLLLDATIPLGSVGSACEFRLLVHDEPLSRNQMALVPCKCLRQTLRLCKPQIKVIALVAGNYPDPLAVAAQCTLADAFSPQEGHTKILSVVTLCFHYATEPQLETLLCDVAISTDIRMCLYAAYEYTQLATMVVEESQALQVAELTVDICLILGDFDKILEGTKQALIALGCLARQLQIDTLDLAQIAAAVSGEVQDCLSQTHEGHNLQLFPFPVGTTEADCPVREFRFEYLIRKALDKETLWREWPLPHPLGFAGGPILLPSSRKAWMDDEDPRKTQAVAFLPVDVVKEDNEELAIVEGATDKPLAILALSCCCWQQPASQMQHAMP
ncbi:hypothetical protein cyc_01528 [Cyclospora cayetanensis]|uniref:Uncharacterized protein n=1 Tax=Cyclospora cayetanensis TaxID=88456 RepID=A0A1D3D6Z2_9EIME|nr:hypothetical protein cyc_01528 [Cyclospora cayetanensis]